MKISPLLICTLLFASTGFLAAKGGKDQDKDRQAIKDARDKEREAVKEYLDGRDKNKDGSLSLDEFIAAEGADEDVAKATFNAANKNKDRVLSKSEIADMIGVGNLTKEAKEKIREAKDKKKDKK